MEGPKIIYRDKLGEDGSRNVTYEMDGVNVNNIE